jgi:hypothetical protein
VKAAIVGFGGEPSGTVVVSRLRMDDEPWKKREEARSSNHVADDESSTPPLEPGRSDDASARAPSGGAARARHGGPYRDARDVLLAKRRRVLASLAQAERAAEQATSLRDELAYVESSLRTSAASMLERVRIATPCRARWEDMAGDDVVRHCSRCGKDVYDLASMTTSEAEALLASDGQRPCVRLRRRRDGRVVTADCPPPSWSERTGARLATAGAAAAVAIAGGVVAAHAFPTEPGCEAPARASTSRGLPWLEELAEHDTGATMGAPAILPTFEVSETTLGIGWPSTTRFVPAEAADGSAGVKVFGVHPRSALATMGLLNGDLLLGIGQTRTTTPAHAIDGLAELQARGGTILQLERRGQRVEHFVVVVRGASPRF